jgi:protein arginine kinase activator
MLCDDCRERDATITLTHAVKGEVTVLHLCQTCASERGIETSAATPFKNLIGDLVPVVKQQAALAPIETQPCSFCGMTLRDFRETGRLGCARCYGTFEVSLRELLRKVHGNARHVGRTYEPPPPEHQGDGSAVGELRERLRRAIANEQFELAAVLRDQIRVLE